MEKWPKLEQGARVTSLYGTMKAKFVILEAQLFNLFLCHCSRLEGIKLFCFTESECALFSLTMAGSDEEFEEQIRLEARAKDIEDHKKEEAEAELLQGRTKTDPDGTVYEWDTDKKAWFPKVEVFLLFFMML
jgi:hypothetical protein